MRLLRCVVLVCSCVAAWPARAAPDAAAASSGFFEGCGAHFYDGLTYVWAFNSEAARQAFADEMDYNPGCPVALWGIAMAHAVDMIFSPDVRIMGASRDALAAAREAVQALPANALAHELVDATARLFGPQGGVDVASWIEAMGEVYARHPDDVEVGTLYALALLHRWGSCHGERPGFFADDAEIFSVLERVLRLDPQHVGALHLYLHARERSSAPERALPHARALPGLAPSLGHLQHMPAHIYLRVGMYEDAFDANTRAIAVDDAYFAAGGPRRGVYYDYLYLHNHHFRWSAALMLERPREALDEARFLARATPETLRRVPYLYDTYAGTESVAYVRLGQWQAALHADMPARGGAYARTLVYLARGMGALRLGNLPQAREALAAMESHEQAVARHDAQALMALACRLLRAETFEAEGRAHEADVAYAEAVSIEDALQYAEPWPWQLPVRDFWAASLAARGDARGAVRLCDDELARHPDNRFALRIRHGALGSN